MDSVKVSGLIHEKTSKNGNSYIALDVNLTPTYVKTFFLDPGDVEVLKLYLETERLKANNIVK